MAGVFHQTFPKVVEQKILGSRPAPPPPYTVRPNLRSPQRKGVLQFKFKGEPQFGEVARLNAGVEVTEVKAAGEDWTLVKTPDGTVGKVPTDFISWRTPGQHQRTV